MLSGMTMGNLIAPWLAGIVYEKAGYYAVFAIILAIIAFDFILRVVMIEKRNAVKWLPDDKLADSSETREESERWLNSTERGTSTGESGVLNREEAHHVTSPKKTPSLQDQTPGPDETSPLLSGREKSSSSWLTRTFPRMTLLLRSPRILAATWGAFTHTMLIAYLDATLPLFVKNVFNWGSKGAGLIFLACSAPSLLGTMFGMLSDRFGTRKVSAIGFALLVPSLALLGTVRNDHVEDIVLLCILLVLIGEDGLGNNLLIIAANFTM